MKLLLILFVAVIITPSAFALFGLFDNNIIVTSLNLQEGSNIDLDPNTITGFGTIGLVKEPVIDGNLTINGDLILRDRVLSVVDQEFNASILPTEDDSFDLGSAALRWQDGFFSNVVTAGSIIGGTWNQSGTNVFPKLINSNVGIGTTTPNTRLDIKLASGTDGIRIEESGAGTQSWTLTNADGDFIFFDVGTPQVVFKDNGGVGFGTDAPFGALHLKDNHAENNLTFESTGLPPTILAGQGFGSIDFYSSDTSGEGPGYIARIRAYQEANSGFARGNIGLFTGWTANDKEPIERMTLNEIGNIGINKTNPVETLDVIGTFSVVTADSVQGLFQDGIGNVGVGTTIPPSKLAVSSGVANTAGDSMGTLSVTGASSTTAPQIISASNTAQAADKGGSIGFSGLDQSSGTTNVIWGMIRGYKENSNAGNGNAYMSFVVRQDGTGQNERMRIK